MILAFLMAAQALLTPTTAPGERVCVTLPLTGLYYLRATAWDAEGNQSALSNQVTKTFPGGNPVCWENPTANIDGTPLADLAQVTLYYDTVPITGGGTPPPPPTVVVGATCPTCAVLQTTLHIGLAGQAIQLTWQGVATAGEEFRRAIAEREFFQMVEDHEWKRAEAALKGMADSPDVGVLQSGLAAELAKEGQLDAALKIAGQLPLSLPARLEILRLAYEKHGSSLSPEALTELLAKHTDPEVIVSLIIGHVGGFRRVPAEG